MGDLVLADVDVSVGFRPILQGVSLLLRPGELCAIIGPSGAGKSTLVKLLLGLRRTARGEVALPGGTIGYVPQDDALHRTLRVREEMECAARLRLGGLSADERAARVAAVAEQVGLADHLDARIGRLSGGQRKRVAVAVELLTEPPLLLLDEPTSGLDPGLEARAMQLFAEVARRGRVVLVTTHAMQSLDLCDVLVVMAGGRIAWAGPPSAAPAWFGAPDYAGIFDRLPSRAPSAWHASWLQSPERARPRPALAAPRPALPATVLPPREQARILAGRYARSLLGDLPTTVLLVGQAPLIGVLCTVVWRSVETDTPSLHFVLSLSAVWFGCISACREVVKDRAIWERERAFGVSAAAWLAARAGVLSALGLVQVVLLLGAVEWHLALRGPLVLQAVALWGAAACGVALGLLVSALARRQERAVGAVPLLLLPQILFSEFAVPRETFGRAVEVVERFMPVRWAWRVFQEAAAPEPRWSDVAVALSVLAVYPLAVGGLAWLALLPRREVDP